MSLRDRLLDFFLDAWEKALTATVKFILDPFGEQSADVIVYDRSMNERLVCWRDDDGRLVCVEAGEW